MARDPITTRDLWELPRVGGAVPSADGTFAVVPIRRSEMDANRSITRLWRVSAPPGSSRRVGDATPLTAPDRSATSPALSTDGTRLAFLRKPGAGPKDGPSSEHDCKHVDQRQLYVMPMDGGEPERVTDLPLGAEAPAWLPDGRRIAFFSSLYPDALTIEATAARKKEIDESPVKVHVTENRVYRIWDTWITDAKARHVFVLDLETRTLVDLTPSSTRWGEGPLDVAPDGREIAFPAVRAEPPFDPITWGVYIVSVPARLHPDRGGRMRAIRVAGAANLWGPRYSPDGRWLVCGLQRDATFYGDRVRLVAIDRRTRKHTVLTEAWDRSADSWAFGASPRDLFLVAGTHGRSAIFHLDLPAAVRRDDARRPRQRHRGGSFDAVAVGGDRLWLTESSLDAPGEVFTLLHSGRGRRRATHATEPAMSRVRTGAVHEYIFDGAEGDPVQMYVVLPPNAPTGPKPLVHLIHGGPHGTFGDGWHWRWCAQSFAARGYVTALVNFHGSTSWGHDFTASILGRWGDQPYIDIMRATDLLIEEGLVDRRRMAIAGGSYGGYLVSWICSQTDRFACAVNHAGVADLQSQYASDFTQGRRRAMGGEPWSNLEGLDRYNPMRHAEGFRTPMLVLHGELDYRVPYTQGLEVYNVYKAMGLEARLVCYSNENHWILQPRNSEHWYGEVFAWLDRWLKRRRRR